MKPPYPFKEREEMYRKYSDEELDFALTDATETRNIWARANRERSTGEFDSDENFYADDVHTIAAEIRRRREARKKPGGFPREFVDRFFPG